MDITFLKILFLCGAFGVTLLFTLIPLKLFCRDKSKPVRTGYKRVLSFCNCVSGGVFMAVCYVMLTPYVRNKFQHVFEMAHIQMTYPISEVVIVCGFFMVLPIEQLIHSCQKPLSRSHQQEMHPLQNNDSSESEKEDSNYNHSNNVSHVHCHASGVDLSNGLTLQSIVMIVALSTHSLFEGLAVGLQTEMEKLVQLYIGIITHEVLVAFAVGVNLAQQRASLSTIVKLLLLFSIVIPLGIGLGMAIEMFDSLAEEAVSAVLQGLATGTFLYVVFIDIVPAELNSPGDKMLKSMFMFIGFAVAAGLTFLLHKEKVN